MSKPSLVSLKDGRALSLENIENDLVTAELILTGAVEALEEIRADTNLPESFYPKLHLVTAAIGRAVYLIEAAIPDSARVEG
jgi:hypothetical protein